MLIKNKNIIGQQGLPNLSKFVSINVFAHHWSESLRDGVDILDYQETKVLEKTEKKRKRKTKSA
jgi:hypothetical protein